MEFFDRLGDIAKSVGEKTVDIAKNIGDQASDAIAIQKIKTKITSERRGFEDQMKLIGQFYYEAFLRGEVIDEGVKAYLLKAQEHAAEIEKGKAEIETLKQDLPSK